MSVSAKPNMFYDLAAIKDIPILSVADRMGVDVQKRGKNYWCKIRSEKNPSVVLHPDTNRFYDFGNQEHGDVIRFVQYAKDVSCGEAIRYLGNAFGLEPNMTRQQLIDRPLTNWEYSRIGLHGDMAAKNFAFPIESATVEELSDISWHYRRLTLNELQKQEPDVYRDLIRKKAVPYVDGLRSSYYLDIWNHFHLLYAMGDNSTNLFRAQKVRDRFSKDTKSLNRAEQILYRACRNAGLEPPDPPNHDPVNVIRQLLHGELSISLGNADAKWLEQKAQQTGCKVLEADVPFYSYFDDRLMSFDHAAIYRAGKVTVQYLSSDAGYLRSVLDTLSQEPDRSLEQKIQKAAEKRSAKEDAEKNEKTFEFR